MTFRKANKYSPHTRRVLEVHIFPRRKVWFVLLPAGYLVIFITFRAHTLLSRVYLRLPALLATSEYNAYYIIPALTATSENYLYCIPLFSAPVRALPPFRPNPGPT